jgi:hypothetical protein
MVLIEQPSKPFMTTDKGSVRAHATRILYDEEINAAYDSLIGAHETCGPLPDVDDLYIRDTIRKIVLDTCGKLVEDNTDIFDTG